MKLNENGDFCLLYIEPDDEKHSLFALIGEQQKPVVLILPLAGQPRARLFQRPEDFSDLKHVRRQNGVSIVFVTTGSERLAQMATRYGFPAYSSIDDFANFLAHGYQVPRADGDGKLYPPPLRRARTGPLMPSAAVAQLAALRKPVVTRPLNTHALSDPWNGHERGAQPGDQPGQQALSEPWTGHKSGELRASPLDRREHYSSWSEPESEELSSDSFYEHVGSDPWSGQEGEASPRELEYEYAAFHEAQTAPLGGAAAHLAWPIPGEAILSVLADGRNTSPNPGRIHGYQGPSSAHGRSPANVDTPAQESFQEPAPRRSTSLPAEPHTRQPAWEVAESMFESGKPPVPVRLPNSSGPTQGLRGASRPTRDLREHSLGPTPASTGAAPSRPLVDGVGKERSRAQADATLAPSHGMGTGRSRPQADATLALTRPLVDGMVTGRARPLADTMLAPSRPQPGTGLSSARPGQKLPTLTPPGRQVQKRGSVWPLLVILSLLIVTGGALGSFVAIAHIMPAAPTAVRPVGSVAFLSSEQLNANTSQGIDDQVQISLHSLGTPAPGKSYYAWLLGDTTQSESQSILLGKLTISGGAANLLYSGDALHTNLLQITSRFLVTEEDGAVNPLMPSPDMGTWRYYGALPAVPDQNDAHHFSFLNHLRHLLADEPILDELELPGGLNNWFTRNTQELIQLASSARDRWQNGQSPASIRAQGVQLLSYLDGMSFVIQDLPLASANVQTTLNTHQAALGLLDVRSSTQNPPGYLDQIVYHLHGLLNAPGSPGSVRVAVSPLLLALSNVTSWLQQLRSDDKNLLALSDTRLGQPGALSLLDDMVLQASNAYSGNTDATASKPEPGVAWIHQQLQSIAMLDISTYIIGQTPVPEVAPPSQSGPASLLPLLNVWKELERLL
ncbi:MAG TPA: hypothetical protein VGD98_00390 [Ktedonobacteraceae bacterium]